MAVFILCLISAFLMMFNAYNPYLGLPQKIYALIFPSVLDFFPMYTLLRRKMIRKKWFILACVGLLCLLVLFQVFFK